MPRLARLAPHKLPLRKVLAALHLWLGLALCLPFLLMGLTGSILVYGDELERLFGTAPRATAQGNTADPAAILAAARLALPGQTANRLTMPVAPGDAAIIRFTAQERRAARQVFVDPVSLQVLAIRGVQEGWLRFIHNLHANLLLEGRPGRAVIGWFGVILLVMATSGLYLWWPRNGKWRQAISVKRGAKGYRLQRDLHGMAGFWALPFLLLLILSGLSMCFPQTIGDAIRSLLPGRDLREAVTTAKVAVPVGGQPVGLDQAIALAAEAAPGRHFAVAYLPLKPEQAWRLAFTAPGAGTDLPGVTVLLDPYRGTRIEVQDPARYTIGEKLLVWLRPLHYGLAAGPLYRLLICLTGLALPLFAATGLIMWWLKRRARRRANTAAGAPQGAVATAASRQSQARKCRAGETSSLPG